MEKPSAYRRIFQTEEQARSLFESTYGDRLNSEYFVKPDDGLIEKAVACFEITVDPSNQSDRNLIPDFACLAIAAGYKQIIAPIVLSDNDPLDEHSPRHLNRVLFFLEKPRSKDFFFSK